MVEVVLPLALTILKKMEESQPVFPTRTFRPWFVSEGHNPQVPAFVDGYRKYWLIWTRLPQIPSVVEN